MSTAFKTVLLAMATAWLVTPTLARAEFVPRVTPMQAVREPATSPLAALDFLSQAVNRDAPSVGWVREPALGAGFDFAADGNRDRADPLGLGRSLVPPTELRGDTDLFLWSLLRIDHAQRGGQRFELVDRGVEFVLTHHTEQPSAVPLPGALWLFVMGILGLAGTRLTGVGSAPAQAGRHEPAMPTGAAVPA